MNKKSDSEKLQTVLNALNLTANAFSQKLGYKSHSSVYHVLDPRRKSKLNTNMVRKIVNTFPNINNDYLIEGELPVLLDDNSIISQANKLNIPIQTDTDISKIKRILDIPDQLDRIESKLDQLLSKQ
ncbi:hypothetical protein [Zobellia sp. B3R18]|uniref:hypothetical protein n=1 Tax=Zobellia sp. B3R18 TaxID=2841568 RepID=UPI001C065677|nr:hypothetical protein [Zobellia sp. B3R18]MBU2973801.1 hypothetical protein [Zobellia sp. B3R18]